MFFSIDMFNFGGEFNMVKEKISEYFDKNHIKHRLLMVNFDSRVYSSNENESSLIRITTNSLSFYRNRKKLISFLFSFNVSAVIEFRYLKYLRIEEASINN